MKLIYELPLAQRQALEAAGGKDEQILYCIPFEYEGLTLEDIGKKFKDASYGQIILFMDGIIRGGPLSAKMFKTGELFPMK